MYELPGGVAFVAGGLFVILFIWILRIGSRLGRLERMVDALRTGGAVSPPPPAPGSGSSWGPTVVGLSSAVASPTVGIVSPAAPADVLPAVRALVQQGQLIQAIKLHRERTGLGLRESKDVIDAIRAELDGHR